MRVLCLNPYLPPPVGGIEKEMLAVAAELVQAGHDVTVMTTTARFPAGTNAPPVGLPAGVRAIRRRGWVRSTWRGFTPARAPLVVPGLAGAVRDAAPELALVFNVGWRPPLIGALAALRGRAPILYRTYFHPPGGILRRAKARYILGAAARADRAIVATECERQQLLASGCLEAAQVIVIPPGVHEHTADPDRRETLRRRFDLVGRTVVAHVARLSIFKGTGHLIEALPEVRRRTGRDVVLLLIGADHAAEELTALARAGGVEAHVRRIGEITDDAELRTLLELCDLFALPSEYEAFGIAYIEAQAAGLPCIGCDVGGVREAVGDGGLLLARFGDRAALSDAMVALLGDDTRRREMGERAQRRVRSELLWRHCAERLVRCGDEVRRELGLAPVAGPPPRSESE